ncbi:hypothetical protein [Peribacillus acanthi]|uniref:hypothetical protein n=1 Tax=Peribacillus acanthi TaxID=2171554 RepID=UPI000D3E02A2|nr:hypothetical protein [Peribacillus acanthi]
MKKWGMILVLLLVLTGCRSTPFSGHSVIDWVDFIKWDGIKYNGIYSGVLADESFLGEKLGKVKFKVADNVTNSSYKIRNGDAAFHEKGTEIYKIKGYPELIAVKSDREINGYAVYFAIDESEFKWHFKDMPKEYVHKIQIYKFNPNGNKLVSEWTEKEDVVHFLQLLQRSEPNSTFQPNTEKGDPILYEMIFYTEEPVAYKYILQFDGESYFWHPWDTEIISDKIETFLE